VEVGTAVAGVAAKAAATRLATAAAGFQDASAAAAA